MLLSHIFPKSFNRPSFGHPFVGILNTLSCTSTNPTSSYTLFRYRAITTGLLSVSEAAQRSWDHRARALSEVKVPSSEEKIPSNSWDSKKPPGLRAWKACVAIWSRKEDQQPAVTRVWM